MKRSRAISPGLGRRVRDLREARGWTTRDLADQCRRFGAPLDHARIVRIERGQVGVTAPTLAALALALDTSSDYLLGIRQK